MCLVVSYAEHQCYNGALCLCSFVFCNPKYIRVGRAEQAAQDTGSELHHLSDEGKTWYNCLSPSPSWVDVEILTELNIAIIMLLAA